MSLYSSFLYSALTCTLYLGACARSHHVTRANEQHRSMTITYYNRQLNTSLLLNGDYELALQPAPRMDSLTQTQVKKLHLARRQTTLLFTARTTIAPFYRLRGVLVQAQPDWSANGFTPVGPGRYQRASTVASDLLLEHVVALPNQRGWLYLLASDHARSQPTTSEQVRRYEMGIEFESFTFPSVQPGRRPQLVSPIRLAQEAFWRRPNGDYLAPLIALAQSRQAPAPPNEPFQDALLWQILQQYHCLAGNRDSVDYFQQQGPERVRRPTQALPATALTPVDRMPVADTLRSVDAVPEILRRAEGMRAVLLNESHTQAQHRVLAHLLLPGLYAQGFRYLALETLEDTLANQQHPLPLHAGFYTREATFANFVRTARRLGFTLVPYEATAKQAERELGEATNLRAALRHDPQARVLVYGGGSHMNRLPAGSTEKKWMAQHLVDLTGWPLLSINQTRMGPEARPGLAAVAPGRAQVVYRGRGSQRLCPYPENELVVRNNLTLLPPLPDATATTTRAIALDVRPFRPTAITGRRMVQLYEQPEFTLREDIAPIYVHEVRSTDKVLTLRLVPGHYVYRVLSEQQKEEVRQYLEVK